MPRTRQRRRSLVSYCVCMFCMFSWFHLRFKFLKIFTNFFLLIDCKLVKGKIYTILCCGPKRFFHTIVFTVLVLSVSEQQKRFVCAICNNGVNLHLFVNVHLFSFWLVWVGGAQSNYLLGFVGAVRFCSLSQSNCDGCNFISNPLHLHSIFPRRCSRIRIISSSDIFLECFDTR